MTSCSPLHSVGSGYGVNTGATGYGLRCLDVSSIFPGTMIGLGECGNNGNAGRSTSSISPTKSPTYGNHSFKWGYEQVFVNFNDSSTATHNGTTPLRTWKNFLEGTPTSSNREHHHGR